MAQEHHIRFGILLHDIHIHDHTNHVHRVHDSLHNIRDVHNIRKDVRNIRTLKEYKSDNVRLRVI